MKKQEVNEGIIIENDNRLLGYSKARLFTYQLDKEQCSVDKLLPIYYWNIRVCESLYPALQIVEVALRNHLWGAIASLTGDTDWLISSDRVLQEKEQKILLETQGKIRKIKTHYHRSFEANHLISELNFGFWTNLLNRRYEGILWPKLFKAVFPYLLKKNRTREYVGVRFAKIRDLRNRVFHHQKVVHLSDLEMQYSYILEAIGWIEPKLLDDLKIVDRFLISFKEEKENIKMAFEKQNVFQEVLEKTVFSNFSESETNVFAEADEKMV